MRTGLVCRDDRTPTFEHLSKSALSWGSPALILSLVWSASAVLRRLGGTLSLPLSAQNNSAKSSARTNFPLIEANRP